MQDAAATSLPASDSTACPGVVQVAVPVPLYRLFDYLPPPEQLSPGRGSRVLVPFGRRMLVGIVVGQRPPLDDSQLTLKPIEQVLDYELIDNELLGVLEWTTGYYAAPPGELVGHILPRALRKTIAVRAPPPGWFRITEKGKAAELDRAPRQARVQTLLGCRPLQREALLADGASADALRRMLAAGLIEACTRPSAVPQPGPELNRDQRLALARILRARSRFQALVLAGVTGSGKTEVYLQAARHLLRRGRQILILLPEIGLTPQFVRRLESRLGHPAWVYHSGLSDGERLATWQAAQDGTARLLVGTRSAVFLPLRAAGLIVVDEEHDSSFKQFDGMRYHGRDVAVLRASRLGIPIVLGSATPSLESLLNCERQRYQLLELPKRAGTAAQPRWHIHDPCGQPIEDGLTEELRKRIRARLEMGQQVLIYRNRRGFAPVLMCNECGWQADCDHCSAHLTWHRGARRLNCHHCGSWRAAPPRCPECQSPQLEALGAGTERIEAAMEQHFPDYPVLRADRDRIRKREDFEQLLDQVSTGKPCILVGTQMLAKGHHLPGIGLAIILDTDQLLFSADFRAPERLSQAVVQVAGRAGREQPGEFILQSRHPEHPLIQMLANSNYLSSAKLLLEERKMADLPPCWSLAMLRAESRDPAQARDFLASLVPAIDTRRIRIAGPLAAILQRRAGYWRYQLWMMAENRKALSREIQALIKQIEGMPAARQLRWHFDVDPLEL
ncbi:MAG: primosomal protein N' [Wenzhouxiangellaceae bacterium]|nr:primosomal protein N' [Wenzhouxiangellaceae bacterium]